MRRVLIANRGEIALRAVRACRQLGLETVAVYSSADSNFPHRLAADHAICLGPPAASLSYLNASPLIEAARGTAATRSTRVTASYPRRALSPQPAARRGSPSSARAPRPSA